MSDREVKEMLSEARQLVSNHCSQIVKTIGEMGYLDHERETFCKLVSGQFLGAGLDLWLEINGDDPEPLKRFCDHATTSANRARHRVKSSEKSLITLGF